MSAIIPFSPQMTVGQLPLGFEQAFTAAVQPATVAESLRRARLNNALQEALAPFQVQAAQREASMAPAEDALKRAQMAEATRQLGRAPMEQTISDINQGIYTALQKPGQPASLPAVPISGREQEIIQSGPSDVVPEPKPGVSGFVPVQPGGVGRPAAQTVDFQQALEEAFPSPTISQVGPGAVYAPETSAASRKGETEFSRALELAKTKGDMSLDKAIALALMKPQPGQWQKTNLVSPSGEPLMFNPTTGEYRAQEGMQATTPAIIAKASQAFGVNPAALQGAINLFRTTGQTPSVRAGKELLNAFYAALGGEGQEDIDLASQAAANKAVRSGMTKAYATQRNLLAANTVAINTIEGQMEIAKPLMKKQDPTGVPFLNKYSMWYKGQIEGDADTAAAQQIIKTMSQEFAKIMSGATASIAGTSVSSAADAEKLLNASMANGQFLKVADTMQKEAKIRIDQQRQETERLQNELQQIGKTVVPSGEKETTAPGTPPSTGEGSVTLQSGKVIRYRRE